MMIIMSPIQRLFEVTSSSSKTTTWAAPCSHFIARTSAASAFRTDGTSRRPRALTRPHVGSTVTALTSTASALGQAQPYSREGAGTALQAEPPEPKHDFHFMKCTTDKQAQPCSSVVPVLLFLKCTTDKQAQPCSSVVCVLLVSTLVFRLRV